MSADRWHQHDWQGVHVMAHDHPDATPGHSHDDYELILELGRFPRLERDGRRLPGEVAPGEDEADDIESHRLFERILGKVSQGQTRPKDPAVRPATEARHIE